MKSLRISKKLLMVAVVMLLAVMSVYADGTTSYTVDFSYDGKIVSIDGGSTNYNLSSLISELGINEEITDIKIYDSSKTTVYNDNMVFNDENILFSVVKNINTWRFNSMNSFDEEFFMLLTSSLDEYEIIISDPASVGVYCLATENGTFSVDKSLTVPNATVTITTVPDAGYEVDTVSVKKSVALTDVDVNDLGNGKYTFKIPSSAVNVSVTFKIKGFVPTDKVQEIDTIVMTNNHDGTVSFDTPTLQGNTVGSVTVEASELAWYYDAGFGEDSYFVDEPLGKDTFLGSSNTAQEYWGATQLTNPVNIEDIYVDSGEIPRIVIVPISTLSSFPGSTYFYAYQFFTLPTEIVYDLNGGTAGTGFVAKDWVLSGGEWLTINGVSNHSISPTKNGFAFDGWYTSATGGTKVETTAQADVAAGLVQEGDDGRRSVTLYAHFSMPTEITSVELTEISAPVAGTALDTIATCGTTGVTASAVSWETDSTTATGNAAAGKTYKAKVVLTAGTGYQFTNSTTATINTQSATVAKNSDTQLTVTYTFRATAATPTINTQPSAQTKTAGEDAVFTVAATASDSGILTYQWQKQTGGEGAWSAVSGATSASYTVSSTTTAMSGDKYRCVITNTKGSETPSNKAEITSAAVALTVNSSTPDNLYLTGSHCSWEVQPNDYKFTKAENANEWTLEIHVDNPSTSQFKINDGTWAFTLISTAQIEVGTEYVLSNDGGNMVFANNVSAGTYRFAVTKSDTTWKLKVTEVTSTPSVAKIGTTEYATLDAALNAAQDGDTITLLTDVSLSSTITIPNSFSGELTLDLDNHKIVVTSGYITAISFSPAEGNNPTLNIKNGTVAYVNCQCIEMERGYLNVENVTIYHTGTGGFYGIKMRNGELKIKNSTIDGTVEFLEANTNGNLIENCVLTSIFKTGTGALTINNSNESENIKGQISLNAGKIVFESGYSNSNTGIGIECKDGTELSITGGKFTGTAVSVATGATATISISGGYYSTAPIDAYIATGYEIVDTPDGAEKTAGFIKTVSPSTPTHSWTYKVEGNSIVATCSHCSETATVELMGNTMVLVPTVLPENAFDKTVTWSSSDTSVATVENGKVTAVGGGTATITATANDGSGKTGTAAITVVRMIHIHALDNNTTLRINSELPVKLMNTDDFESSIKTGDTVTISWGSGHSRGFSVYTYQDNIGSKQYVEDDSVSGNFNSPYTFAIPDDGNNYYIEASWEIT